MAWLLIFVGGGAGACARYGIGSLAGRWFGAAFPAHTLLVNVTGSFLIGLISTILIQRGVPDPAWRLAIVTGFLGGYTTFSAFSYETIQLIQDGHGGRALLYVLLSNGLGILACALGIVAVRWSGLSG
ncbi:MAG TPA: fluoride efflux transporter CrcB [Thermomicrobiales bacterium]|jgi:CrcB protein|nr:fluoride efflux transporter CrcB [Thermomicrobiales bacterium]